MELDQVLQVLKDSGVTIVLPESKHLSLEEAGDKIGLGKDWVRGHLNEFPNAWRLPGAGTSGELRIPSSDVESFAKRRRIKRL